jgi:hypothetical protein
MDNSQVELIEEKAFLDIRAKVSEILIEHGILDTYEGKVGWWVNNGGPAFISLYDVLEDARVQH